MDARTHDDLAELLRYPDAAGRRRILEAGRALRAGDPALAGDLAPFLRWVGESDATDPEERYTHTFDINPVCSLEVGWHLYGEDYSRGVFLVRMRDLMRRAGVKETAELPDHLCGVLAVLGRLPLPEAARLSREFVQPAVDRMLGGFGEKEHAYRGVLEAVRGFLRRRYGEPAAVAGSVAGRPYDACSACPVLDVEGDPHD